MFNSGPGLSYARVAQRIERCRDSSICRLQAQTFCAKRLQIGCFEHVLKMPVRIWPRPPFEVQFSRAQ